MKSLKYIGLSLAIVLGLGFSGCSGGGGSSSDPVTATTVTGQFIDAAVQGLGYLCSSGKRDKTNSNGEYICNVGDNVTFFIGSVNLGTVAAQSAAITPYTLLPNSREAAINLARLLQSVDTSSTDNIIIINTALEASIPTDTDFASSSFEADVQTALGITLISSQDAETSMNEAIIEVGGSIPTDSNSIPTANAGLDQNIATTSQVTLNGSASADANSDPLTYAWSITSKPAGSSATLSNAAIVNPTFTADLDGSYILQLVVNDGMVDSAADTVTITATASTSNSAPVANAGADQTVLSYTTVILNGSGSYDNDGDGLSFNWNFVSKPNGSSVILSDITTANPTFIPDINGTYIIKLIVNDGIVDSMEDTIIIDSINSDISLIKLVLPLIIPNNAQVTVKTLGIDSYGNEIDITNDCFITIKDNAIANYQKQPDHQVWNRVITTSTGNTKIISSYYNLTSEQNLTVVEATYIGGQYTNDLNLAKGNSPYVITDMIQTAPGTVLTIEKGVEVYNDGRNVIQVFGDLNISGSDTSYVYLNSIPINVEDDTNISISYAKFLYGSVYTSGYSLKEFTLSDSVLEHGFYINARNTDTIWKIEKNIFNNSNLNLWNAGSNFSILNNLFTSSSRISISAATDLAINYNSFMNTNTIVIEMSNTNATLDATNNYWNSILNTTIDGMIFDNNDDFIVPATVGYSPFLVLPDLNTPLN
jgi:hypothetical protein